MRRYHQRGDRGQQRSYSRRYPERPGNRGCSEREDGFGRSSVATWTVVEAVGYLVSWFTRHGWRDQARLERDHVAADAHESFRGFKPRLYIRQTSPSQRRNDATDMLAQQIRHLHVTVSIAVPRDGEVEPFSTFPSLSQTPSHVVLLHFANCPITLPENNQRPGSGNYLTMKNILRMKP